jgi:5-carboxymethyl-2-hydroxymuconate isomerase
METGRNFSMSGIISGHHNLPTYEMSLKSDNVEFVRYCEISTGRHFQNGHHNTTQIQHCPISTLFHMWVDYDVPN